MLEPTFSQVKERFSNLVFSQILPREVDKVSRPLSRDSQALKSVEWPVYPCFCHPQVINKLEVEFK